MKSHALLFLLSIGLILHSCKKNENETDNSNTPPSNELTVSFTDATIADADVDSVKVEFINKATQHKVVKKLDKKTKAFSIAFTDLEAGSWQANMVVYKRIVNQGGYYFQLSKDITLPLSQALVVQGPTAQLSDSWKSWILFTNNETTVMLPMDPSDPNFSIKTLDQNWGYFYVERHLYNETNAGTASVDAVTWECYDNCYTQTNIINNSSSFAGFASTANAKTWNKGEVLVIIAGDGGRDHTFYLLYDR